MSLTAQTDNNVIKRKFTVILVKPEKPENIGLVARCMRNTGFESLRLVGVNTLAQKSYLAAVHARRILEKASLFNDLSEATSDLNLIFAATSKKRKNFTLYPLEQAVTRMFKFPFSTKIGLLFGCERTGLTSEELKRANFTFVIPQASKQPPYNLSSAVLITLFQIFNHNQTKEDDVIRREPISRKEQEECIRLILKKLEEKKFIHKGNKPHVKEMIYDLFGRLTMSSRDRRLLLALFSKGVNSKE